MSVKLRGKLYDGKLYYSKTNNEQCSLLWIDLTRWAKIENLER